MNQLYRALHIPPKRLLRKLSGEKEIYTIAVRPVPKAEGTDPLPALGGTPYTMLPARCTTTARQGSGRSPCRRISTSPSPQCLTGTARPG